MHIFQLLLYRATIGPILAGVLDEHFGFEWAMSVSVFSSLEAFDLRYET